jgi:hypothetical protein
MYVSKLESLVFTFLRCIMLVTFENSLRTPADFSVAAWSMVKVHAQRYGGGNDAILRGAP